MRTENINSVNSFLLARAASASNFYFSLPKEAAFGRNAKRNLILFRALLTYLMKTKIYVLDLVKQQKLFLFNFFNNFSYFIRQLLAFVFLTKFDCRKTETQKCFPLKYNLLN